MDTLSRARRLKLIRDEKKKTITTLCRQRTMGEERERQTKGDPNFTKRKEVETKINVIKRNSSSKKGIGHFCSGHLNTVTSIIDTTTCTHRSRYRRTVYLSSLSRCLRDGRVGLYYVIVRSKERRPRRFGTPGTTIYGN